MGGWAHWGGCRSPSSPGPHARGQQVHPRQRHSTSAPCCCSAGFCFPAVSVVLIALNGRVWVLRFFHLSPSAMLGKGSSSPSWSSISCCMSYPKVCTNPTHGETPKLPTQHKQLPQQGTIPQEGHSKIQRKYLYTFEKIHVSNTSGKAWCKSSKTSGLESCWRCSHPLAVPTSSIQKMLHFPIPSPPRKTDPIRHKPRLNLFKSVMLLTSWQLRQHRGAVQVRSANAQAAQGWFGCPCPSPGSEPRQR